MHTEKIITAGLPLDKATKALIMLHGRGGDAADILSLSQYFNLPDFALLAPEATNNTWYPYSFMAPTASNEPWLSSALQLLETTAQKAINAGIPAQQIYWLGFSQGACLTLEYVTRNAVRYGGVAAFTGGLIGDVIHPTNYRGDFGATPVFIGTSDPDPHVPVNRVNESAAILQTMNAAVVKKVYPNMGHTISQDEVEEVNRLLFGTGETG